MAKKKTQKQTVPPAKRSNRLKSKLIKKIGEGHSDNQIPHREISCSEGNSSQQSHKSQNEVKQEEDIEENHEEKISPESSFHYDIDQYLAEGVIQNRIKEQIQTQKRLNQVKNLHPQKNKKEIMQAPLQFCREERIQIQSESNHSLKKIMESVQCQPIIFEPYSPLFGQKQRQMLRTPPNKLEQYKEYDQQINVKSDLIDQFDQKSKISSHSSNNQRQIAVLNDRFEVKFEEVKKQNKPTPSSRKKKKDSAEKLKEEFVFSFKRQRQRQPETPEKQVQRVAECMRLGVLQKTSQRIERSHRLLMMLSQSLCTVINYHQLRQLSPQVLRYRRNVLKGMNQEIEKMSTLLTNKKLICDTIMSSRIKQKQVQTKIVRGKRDSFAKSLTYQ